MSVSPWVAFFPENVSKNPAHFVGPNIAGAIVQAIETGIIINQSIKFWSNSADENSWVQALVAFVSVAAGFQTAVAFYNTWVVIVLGFGNWVTVVDLRWPDRIQPALNCLMAAPFQAFLIWRCWNALRRKLWIIIPLIVLLISSIVANVVITVNLFLFTVEDMLMSRTPPRAYITAFVLTAVLDICITSLMLWFLFRAKSQVVSRRFDKIIGLLLTMLWEAALPPCACAIAACAVYISMSMQNLWDVFCQSILGKLYVISLFVILNGRADLKNVPNAAAKLNASDAGLTRYWVSAAEARVNLTTVIDVDRLDTTNDEGRTPTSAHFGSDRPCIRHQTSITNWEKNGDTDAASIEHIESTLSSRGYMRH